MLPQAVEVSVLQFENFFVVADGYFECLLRFLELSCCAAESNMAVRGIRTPTLLGSRATASSIAVWGSEDDKNWGTKPLLKIPQRFYRARRAKSSTCHSNRRSTSCEQKESSSAGAALHRIRCMSSVSGSPKFPSSPTALRHRSLPALDLPIAILC
jgi:hypothetical protein